MDLIQKYSGADGRKPKLNKLGTAQWGKTKNQVKGAVQADSERSGRTVCCKAAVGRVCVWPGYSMAEGI